MNIYVVSKISTGDEKYVGLSLGVYDSYEKAENNAIKHYFDPIITETDLDSFVCDIKNNGECILSDEDEYHACGFVCQEDSFAIIGVYKEEDEKKLFKFFTWNSDTKEYELSKWVSEEEAPPKLVYFNFELNKDNKNDCYGEEIYDIAECELNGEMSYETSIN